MAKSSTIPERKFSVSLLDVAIMLFHIHAGKTHPKVGFEDLDHSIQALTNQLQQQRVSITKKALESALWSCNLMDEARAFKHPDELTFVAFTKKLLSTSGHAARFNRTYNQINEK